MLCHLCIYQILEGLVNAEAASGDKYLGVSISLEYGFLIQCDDTATPDTSAYISLNLKYLSIESVISRNWMNDQIAHMYPPLPSVVPLAGPPLVISSQFPSGRQGDPGPRSRSYGQG